MKRIFLIGLLLLINITGCAQRDNLLRQDFVRGLPDSLRKKADISWVQAQQFLKNGYTPATTYVTADYVNNTFVTPDLLNGVAYQGWVNQQGFLKQGITPATQYPTVDYVNNNFVTPDLLQGYVTENILANRNYTTIAAVMSYLNYDELIRQYAISITGNASATEDWVAENFATKTQLDSIQSGGGNYSQDTAALHYTKFYAIDTALSNRAYQEHGHSNYVQYVDTTNLHYTKFFQLDTAITNRAYVNHTHSKTVRIPQTYTISGDIKVPSGDTDFINPFFIALPSGQTARLVSCRYVINSGTSATVKLQKNGTDITGFTSISVSTTAASTTPTSVSLTDNDKLALVVTAVSGTPRNLSFTIFIEYTF